MAFIENVSWENVRKGIHTHPGTKSLLIQIVDSNSAFPVPKYEFNEVRQYKFLDVEDTDLLEYKNAITDSQAKDIADTLQYAIANDINVIVHCHMGVCRSGAVVEVGVMLGFIDTKQWRLPNLMVKHKLMKYLDMLPYSNT